MKAFVLLFIVLILSFSSENKQQNDLERSNLKGKVKTLRQISYHAIDKFGEITKGDIDGSGILAPGEYYNKYNDKGFLTESIAKYFDGDTLIFQEIYTYDGYGNEIEIYQSNSEGEIGKETHKYDDKGNPIELNRYYPVDSLEATWRYTYKYDDNDNIIEETTYTNGSSEGRLVTYTYDDKDNLTEVSVYTTVGILHWKNTYKYDDKGNETEMNSYSYDGSLSWKEISKYDDNGNKIESNRFNPYATDFKYIYKYDDKNNLIEEHTYYDGSLSKYEIYKYDYDKKNNWIKQIHFIDGIPKYIIERQIEYY